MVVPTVALLAVAGFSSLVSMRLCDAMLPALAAAFTTSTAEASIVVSAFAVTYGLMQLVLGPLGDRYGKPRVIGLAAGWCAVATMGASMTTNLHDLALARGAMGAGAAAIVPLALAWIGDTVPVERRQEALARYSGASLSGIMVGSWAGGFLTEAVGWRATFATAVPLFAAVSLALRWRSRSPEHAAVVPTEPYLRRVAELFAAPWARLVLGTVAVEGLFTFGFLAFLPTVLHERFGLPLSKAGAILALFALGGIAYSRAARLALARWEPHAVARIGGALMALGFALLAAMPHWTWALVGCPLAGFGFYAFHNTMQTNATQLSPSSRGLAMSMFACCIFVGQSVGVPLAARMFASLHPAWCFGAAGTALGMAALLFTRQLERRSAVTTRAHAP